jgi:hypothetical protein
MPKPPFTPHTATLMTAGQWYGYLLEHIKCPTTDNTITVATHASGAEYTAEGNHWTTIDELYRDSIEKATRHD